MYHDYKRTLTMEDIEANCKCLAKDPKDNRKCQIGKDINLVKCMSYTDRRSGEQLC